MNTKYNILYNGHLAYDEGLKTLSDNYEDDYWQILPIEPLKVEEFAMPGMQGGGANSNASFEKAEEKAVKAVQKHGMNIAGKERNAQIDDAYMLLGKSRYYSQRFVPALEAFNYIIKHYPSANLNAEARIWRAKTLMRINSEELGWQILDLMLGKEELYEPQIIEQAHTAIAMIYTQMDSTYLVKHHLKKAIRTDFNKEQTARNHFILGQLYSQEGHRDSANAVFQHIIDMKRIPYKYQIHAEIEKAKNITDDTDILALNAHLRDLINDRDNRPYLDELYYQAGLVYEYQKQPHIAEENYRKSVKAKNAKQFQRGLSYEKLGDISFDKADFVTAGAYYDSVLSIPQERNTKRIRGLERKRKNLDQVIENEKVAYETDSILGLVAMSEDEQRAYFQSYVDMLKAQKELEEQRNEAIANSGFAGFEEEENLTSSNGKWYFYNTQLSGFGQQKFFQIWGNRSLEDNWRYTDKSFLNANNETEEAIAVVQLDESEKYDVETYLNMIPTDPQELDSLSTTRNEAYYNLGLIYKEQFKESDLAIDRFESLLTFKPKERYVLPAKYHLYKLYEETGSSKQEIMATDITSKYSDSKYAKMISNPNQAVEMGQAELTPEDVYEELYCDYEAAAYQLVLERSDKAIEQYQEEKILPKFELLRAFAIGKVQGPTAFKEALEFIALNYSNTEEGKKATEVISTINANN
ncbi:hypothetical protein KH5_09860 [Urechidicola sp. KH5]